MNTLATLSTLLMVFLTLATASQPAQQHVHHGKEATHTTPPGDLANGKAAGVDANRKRSLEKETPVNSDKTKNEAKVNKHGDEAVTTKGPTTIKKPSGDVNILKSSADVNKSGDDVGKPKSPSGNNKPSDSAGGGMDQANGTGGLAFKEGFVEDEKVTSRKPLNEQHTNITDERLAASELKDRVESQPKPKQDVSRGRQIVRLPNYRNRRANIFDRKRPTLGGIRPYVKTRKHFLNNNVPTNSYLRRPSYRDEYPRVKLRAIPPYNTAGFPRGPTNNIRRRTFGTQAYRPQYFRRYPDNRVNPGFSPKVRRRVLQPITGSMGDRYKPLAAPMKPGYFRPRNLIGRNQPAVPVYRPHVTPLRFFRRNTEEGIEQGYTPNRRKPASLDGSLARRETNGVPLKVRRAQESLEESLNDEITPGTPSWGGSFDDTLSVDQKGREPPSSNDGSFSGEKSPESHALGEEPTRYDGGNSTERATTGIHLQRRQAHPLLFRVMDDEESPGSPSKTPSIDSNERGPTHAFGAGLGNEKTRRLHAHESKPRHSYRGDLASGETPEIHFNGREPFRYDDRNLRDRKTNGIYHNRREAHQRYRAGDKIPQIQPYEREPAHPYRGHLADREISGRRANQRFEGYDNEKSPRLPSNYLPKHSAGGSLGDMETPGVDSNQRRTNQAFGGNLDDGNTLRVTAHERERRHSYPGDLPDREAPEIQSNGREPIRYDERNLADSEALGIHPNRRQAHQRYGGMDDEKTPGLPSNTIPNHSVGGSSGGIKKADVDSPKRGLTHAFHGSLGDEKSPSNRPNKREPEHPYRSHLADREQHSIHSDGRKPSYSYGGSLASREIPGVHPNRKDPPHSHNVADNKSPRVPSKTMGETDFFFSNSSINGKPSAAADITRGPADQGNNHSAIESDDARSPASMKKPNSIGGSETGRYIRARRRYRSMEPKKTPYFEYGRTRFGTRNRRRVYSAPMRSRYIK